MRIFVIALSLFLSFVACAQSEPSPTKFKAGEHYDVISTPVKTITPGKIEVTEVFWYGCGHCYTFESALNAWAKNIPDDTQLVKSPAIWRKNMETHARVFYTAKSLGVLNKAHSKFFDAMHKERKPMTSDSEIAAFFANLGVDKEKFDKVYKSFSVDSLVQQAGARARSFKITGTPEMVVDGRFRVSSSKAGGQEAMLKVVDFLLQEIREKRI